jgi:hypothetical protein
MFSPSDNPPSQDEHILALVRARAKSLGLSEDEFLRKFPLEIHHNTNQEESLSLAKKGLIKFGIKNEEVNAVIVTFATADASTLPHELAHYFRRTLEYPLLVAAENAFDVKNGIWTTQNEEEFAIGFVKYLADQKTPIEDLEKVFEQYGTWLRELWEDVKNTPEAEYQLRDDQKILYDALLGDATAKSKIVEYCNLGARSEYITLYHGTNANFDKFDKVGDKITSIGYGHYFSPNLDVAKQYGKNIKSISIPKKDIIDLDHLTKSQRREIEAKLDAIVPENIKAGYGEYQKKYFKDPSKMDKLEKDEALQFFDKKIKETEHYYHDRAKAVLNADDNGTYVGWMEQGLSGARDSDLKYLIQQYDQSIPRELGYKAARNGDEVAIYDTKYVNDALAISVANRLQEWHKDSHALTKNEDGTPRVFYHGTGVPKKFNIFNTANGPSWFTANKTYAEAFAINGEKPRVMELYLNIKNPIFVGNIDGISNPVSLQRLSDNSGIPIEELTNIRNNISGVNLFDITNNKEFVEIAKKMGYDGIEAKEAGGITTLGAFNSEQIKSIHNRGAFDEVNPNILFQAAYHGTPHIVDKFSAENIGTGEGQQAYGWGLYFSSDREVAEHYAKTIPSYDGKAMREFEHWQQVVIYRIVQDGYEKAKVFYEEQANMQKELFGEVQSLTKRDLDFTNKIDPNRIKGNVYEVDLKPESNEYLNWSGKPSNKLINQVVKSLNNEGVNAFIYGSSVRFEKDNKHYSFDLHNGAALYHGIAQVFGYDERRASEFLYLHGIKGIKYPVGLQKDNHHNYVIFNGNDVEIISVSGGKFQEEINIPSDNTLFGHLHGKSLFDEQPDKKDEDNLNLFKR